MCPVVLEGAQQVIVQLSPTTCLALITRATSNQIEVPSIGAEAHPGQMIPRNRTSIGGSSGDSSGQSNGASLQLPAQQSQKLPASSADLFNNPVYVGADRELQKQ